MSKIKLGQRPESFKPFPVKFVMPDGTDGVITATFKYRTRAEHGQWVNEITKGTPPDFVQDGHLNFEAMYRHFTERNAQDLLDVLVAWDLDEPLSKENLTSLGNEVPAAVAALTASYSVACQEGRLGN